MRQTANRWWLFARLTEYFKKNFWLCAILAMALFLRIYRLGNIPPSLDWDEAAIGYNAYSILKTGRDEYGKIFPVVFKSFGDYKPGFYIYLTIPFIAIFGLTETAVRLPSAIIGAITVWMLYRLCLEVFEEKKIAIFSAAALSVLPWHLQFSRGAWEANVALFFLLLGVHFFFKAVKKPELFYLSSLSFGVSVLCYQGAKMVVPLTILILVFCFWDKIRTIGIHRLVWPTLILGLISAPILLSAFFGGGGRLKVMSVFSYRRPVEEINAIVADCGLGRGGLVFKLFHSEELNLLRGVLGRYFNHFSGKFLFFEGDWSSLRHGPLHSGVLYLPCLVFLVFGLIFLLRKAGKGGLFFILWFLISPLPAALSRDSISAVRALTMILPISIFLGTGLFYFFSLAFHRILRSLLIIVVLGAFLLSAGLYFENYYAHYPKNSSEYWQYGYKEAVILANKIKDNYKRVVFTQKYGQPHIFWLFYNRYDPEAYQSQVKLIENPYGDVGSVEKLDKIVFRNIYWPADRGDKGILYIGTGEEIPLHDIDPKQARVIENIGFLNGKIAFRFAETY